MPPLPKPPEQRRNPNAPPTPDRALPASGRQGPAPRCPVPLGAEGRRFWRWLWATPQAVTWEPTAFAYPLAKLAKAWEEWSAHDHAACDECGCKGGHRDRLWKVLEDGFDRFLLNPQTLTRAHQWIRRDEDVYMRVTSSSRPVTDATSRFRAAGE